VDTKFKKYLLILCSILLPSFILAQDYKVQQAYDCVKNGKLDSAKFYIEVSIKDEIAKNDFQTWYIRGFIYKELYKQKESDNINSASRKIAVESFNKALELDKEKAQYESIVQNLKFLGSKYFNDAKKSIDSVNYETSIDCFKNYISISKSLDQNFDEKTKSIDYYLALSYYFQEIFESKISSKALDKTKEYLNKALEINPNSVMANKNMAVLYYNMGVNIIKKMDYDVDLEELYKLQEEATKLFKHAEPFMAKAYNLSPIDRTILEGMQGIYYQLNDSEKSNEFKKKLEDLNKQN
jgi:tetratricopeptide (TPR) repeat protein